MYIKANPVLPQHKFIPIKLDKQQINGLKKKHYGKWYLKPDEYNFKNEKLLSILDQAVDVQNQQMYYQNKNKMP